MYMSNWSITDFTCRCPYPMINFKLASPTQHLGKGTPCLTCVLYKTVMYVKSLTYRTLLFVKTCNCNVIATFINKLNIQTLVVIFYILFNYQASVNSFLAFMDQSLILL